MSSSSHPPTPTIPDEKTSERLSPEQIQFAEVVGLALAESWRRKVSKSPDSSNRTPPDVMAK